MPTFHLICGLPCSGKTTLARRLEVEEPALYLSPDPWMAQVVRDGYDAQRREAVKVIQLELAGKSLPTLGLRRSCTSWMCRWTNYKDGWRTETRTSRLTHFT
jgi:AAA domain